MSDFINTDEIEEDPRFWWMYPDNELHAAYLALDFIGIVDENAGGIIAWANDIQHAETIINLLNEVATSPN